MLAGVEAHHVAFQNVRFMAAAERRDLVDQLCSLLLCNKAGCLYRVDQYLQFGNAEAAILDIVPFFFADPVPHDLVAKLIENSDIFRQCPALTRNAHLSELAANLTSGEGMLLICLLTQKFKELQQLIFLPVFLCHVPPPRVFLQKGINYHQTL